MKVTLDLTKLREDGQISAAEYEKFLHLGRRETGSLGINILVAFGVIAVSGGLVALLLDPITTLLIGAAVFALGFVLTLRGSEQWSLLAQTCLVLGALLFCGSIVVYDSGSLASIAFITVILAAAGLVARSSLLTGLAVVALAGCLGARTGYTHASYSLAIHEPVLTIIVFSVLAFAAYQISRRVSADYERIAIMAARVSVFLVNFGFWIGSLWGDRITWLSQSGETLVIPKLAFVILWAAGLLSIGIWGAAANRRWVVNIAAVFGAIHFYTQWFGILGPNAASVLLGGALVLVFAFALWHFNRRAQQHVGA